MYALIDMLANKTHELIRSVDNMKSELQVLTNVNEGYLHPFSHESTDSLRRASNLSSFNQFLQSANDEDFYKRTRQGDMVMVTLSDSPMMKAELNVGMLISSEGCARGCPVRTFLKGR